MALPAREAAFRALSASRRSGAWNDLYLNGLIKNGGMEPRDAALASKLCYGVMQNRFLCDYYISVYLTSPIKKLEPALTDILRIGVYQIAFLSRIPPSAAVNESVKLAKKHVNPGAAKLCNAVLRKISDNLPELKREDEEEYLSIRYSCPMWLVKRLRGILGDDAEKLLAAQNSETPVYIQTNSIKAEPETVEKELERLGIKFSRFPGLDGCFALTGAGDIGGLELFRTGKITVQDPAARLAVMAAGPKPGDTVLDVCAAPGGKTFAAAALMENRGRILARDIHKNKLRHIAAGAERLGIGIVETEAADGRTPCPGLSGAADVVIADVPCSGLGVIRKKPDIRYKEPEEIKRLPEIQLAILENVSDFVKPGGTLLYSTCTVLPEENGDVAEKFLRRRDNFAPEDFEFPGILKSQNGMAGLWPHIHGTDGFFIARFRRKK